MRPGIGRGDRGDRVHVPTGVGDEGGRPDFGGGRSSGAPRQRRPAWPPVVAALRGVQRRGVRGGWHRKRGSGSQAWRLGRLGPDV
jgi:hypothetical protein